MEIEKIGTIINIINDIELVVESDHEPSTVIKFDSTLCLEDRTTIGRVDDIFGAVKRPFYFVRLTVDKAIQLKDKLSLNQNVFAVKQLSDFVTPPETGERYSSASECDDASSDDDFAPNFNHNNKNNKNNQRRQRAMSVDRMNTPQIVIRIKKITRTEDIHNHIKENFIIIITIQIIITNDKDL